jgi:prefoldin alpha subunit
MAEKEEQLQKLYLEFQMLEHHIKQLEKQNNALNNQLMELMATNQSLSDMNNVKKGTGILVSLSSGIYAKAELKDNSNFIVNVGSNVALVKDTNSTKNLIETQIVEIKKLREKLADELQEHTIKAAVLEQEINKIASSIKDK